jgi:hypothetical protein
LVRIFANSQHATKSLLYNSRYKDHSCHFAFEFLLVIIVPEQN